MQDYDTVLKLLMKGSAKNLLHQLTNDSITKWVDIQLPVAKQLRVDLLGETADGLEHIELQSQNDSEMPVRMLEYAMAIQGVYGVFPRQTVLYVGKEKLRMSSALEIEQLSFRYTLKDASQLDGEALLASEDIGDNILAILARVPKQEDALRRIMAGIARLDPSKRQDTISQFLIVSGLRGLGKKVREEAEKMPVTESILDHDVIGPVYRSGMEKGRLDGERAIVSRLLEKRFGPLSASVVERLNLSSTAALEEIGTRLLDASSLEEVFP